MSLCNIKRSEVITVLGYENVFQANKFAYNSGYKYFIFNNLVFVTLKPSYFTAKESYTGFGKNDLI
jgi:hypothetical protein